MAKRIRERNRAALAERYERDGVATMTSDQFGDWINGLPVPEFMAMVDLSDEGRREERKPILKPEDLTAARRLRLLVEATDAIRAMIAARRPVPEISLEVDPQWVRENVRYAAGRITRLTDALMRAIAHCDAAEHKTNAYRDERDAILEALCAPSSHAHQ